MILALFPLRQWSGEIIRHVIRFKILSTRTIDLRHLPREMRQMVECKRRNNQPTENHRARGKLRHNITTPMRIYRLHRRIVFHRACLTIFRSQFNGRPNMQTHHSQQPNPCHPKQRPQCMQLGGVFIDRRRPRENQQVAQHMHHHKPKQTRARNGHKILTPQRRFENARDEIHQLHKGIVQTPPAVNGIAELQSAAGILPAALLLHAYFNRFR